MENIKNCIMPQLYFQQTHLPNSEVLFPEKVVIIVGEFVSFFILFDKHEKCLFSLSQTPQPCLTLF